MIDWPKSVRAVLDEKRGKLIWGWGNEGSNYDALYAAIKDLMAVYNAALRALADQDCPDDVAECVFSTESIDCAACWEQTLASHEQGGE